MDDADAADLTQEQHLTVALSKRHATLPACGACYFCAEPVSDGKRFCDADCLSDWERAEGARRRGGRRDE